MKNVSKILETLGFKFDYEKNAKGKRIRMYWIDKSTLIEHQVKKIKFDHQVRECKN